MNCSNGEGAVPGGHTAPSGRPRSLPADLPRTPGRAEAQKERGGSEYGHPAQRQPTRGAGAAALRPVCRVLHRGGGLCCPHPGLQAPEGRSPSQAPAHSRPRGASDDTGGGQPPTRSSFPCRPTRPPSSEAKPLLPVIKVPPAPGQKHGAGQLVPRPQRKLFLALGVSACIYEPEFVC